MEIQKEQITKTLIVPFLFLLKEYFALMEGKSFNYCLYTEKQYRIKNDNSDTPKGLWSSGYDVAFTRRRSPVQIRLSPY